MKKIVAICLLVVSALVIASAAQAKKKPVYRVPGGAPINPLGISIDASYDPRLDDFLPGYKVINVAINNQGFRIIYLDPERDKWKIKLSGKRKAIPVIHDLRSEDPDAWARIPEQAKGLVSYPLALPIGAREVIDLFVPDTVDVQKFNELDIFFKSTESKIEILVRQ